MPDSLVRPEFPWSVPALVAEGVLSMLNADAALAGYMNAIRPFEADELFLEGTLDAPEIGLTLSRYAESRSGASRQATAEIEIVLAYLHYLDGPEGDQWLRARVVDRLHAALLVEAGVVRCPFDTTDYDEGAPLTEALLSFGAVVAPARLPSGNLLMTPIRCVFQSTIRESTRRVLT